LNLRIPGPTPCPPEVLAAMSRPMINHRGPEFADLIARVTARMKPFFQTENDVLTLSASGSGGLEAAVVNTLSPGDRVLAVSIGVFGDRFAETAQIFGADVAKLDFEWGRAADPDAVRRALAADPAIKAVLVTHNETSTGVTNDLEAISAVVREADKLLLVDAVSSLTSIDLPVDAWGCDVVVSGSQKGWMVPPGLTFVSMSPRAWAANATARMPRAYLDLGAAREYLAKGQTPYTPVVSLFFALDVALDLMAAEGLPNIIARHARLAERTRRGVEELGLELFADRAHASNTVTAARVPTGVAAKQIAAALREEGVEIAAGQERLANEIIRIGHLGYVSDADISGALGALERVLTRLGVPRLAARSA
jgi:aspartate aminotransferase-like enzyme